MSDESGCLSARNTLIVFDWDDTILPTTLLRDRTRALMARTLGAMSSSHHSGVMDCGASSSSLDIDEEISEEFEALASMSEKTLEVAEKCGTVCMITNGSSDWIRSSCCRYMPKLWPRLEHLRRVSAKDLAQQHSRDPLQWKKHTFSQVINEYFGRKEMAEQAKVVISVGDSLHERHALYYFFVTTCLSKVAIRSVKLVALPGMAALKAQHAALAMHLPRIAGIDLSCRTADLRYSFVVASEQPMNDEAMEHLAEVAANEEENDFVISSLPLLDDKDADPQPLAVDVESLIYATIKQNKAVENSIRDAVHNTGKKRPLTPEDDDQFLHPAHFHNPQQNGNMHSPLLYDRHSFILHNLQSEEQRPDPRNPLRPASPPAPARSKQSNHSAEEEGHPPRASPHYKYHQVRTEPEPESKAAAEPESEPELKLLTPAELVAAALRAVGVETPEPVAEGNRPPLSPPMTFIHPPTTRVFPSDLLKLVEEEELTANQTPPVAVATQTDRKKVVNSQDLPAAQSCLPNDEDEEVPHEPAETHHTVRQSRPVHNTRAPSEAEPAATEPAADSTACSMQSGSAEAGHGHQEGEEENHDGVELLECSIHHHELTRPPPLSSAVGNFFKGASLSISKIWGRAVNSAVSPTSTNTQCANTLKSDSTSPILPPMAAEGDSTRASTNTATPSPHIKRNTSFGLTPMNSSTPTLRMVVKLNNGNPFLVGHVAGFAFDDNFILHPHTA